jgi:hypothetical protein
MTRWHSGTWRRIAVALACLPLICRPAAAQSGAAADVKALRAIFDDQMRKIGDDTAKGLAAWPAAYEKDLAELASKAQKAGDLEGVQAARQEMERFRKNQQLRTADLVNDRPELRTLQEKHMAAPDAAETEKNSRIVRLKEQYVEHLTALQKKLTMANRLDDAIVVNAEIKRASALPAVTAAEFAMAVKEGEKRVKPPAGGPAAPDAKTGDKPATTNAAAGSNPPKPVAAKPLPKGAKVYEGETPAPIPDFTFKTLSVSPTDRLPVGRKVSATVTLAKRSDTSKTSSDGFFYGYERKTVSAQYILRVTLRPVTSSVALDGAQLAVQYFSKDAAKSAGRIVPNEENLEVIPLPRIDSTRTVAVDCPPLSVTSVSSKTRGYVSGSSWSSGQEFYGVVISVFDADGNLAYQTASMDSLGKSGIAKIPDDFEEERKAKEEADARRQEFFDNMGRRVPPPPRRGRED